MYVRAEHGHATNDSPDFAKLNRRAQVRPIYWNTVGNCYLDLAEPELRFLTRPFDVHGFAMSRPEVLGRDPISEAWRLLRRPRVDLDAELRAGDVLVVQDIFRDLRRLRLRDFLKCTVARTVAIFHDATDLRLPSEFQIEGRFRIHEKYRKSIKQLSSMEA